MQITNKELSALETLVNFCLDKKEFNDMIEMLDCNHGNLPEVESFFENIKEVNYWNDIPENI